MLVAVYLDCTLEAKLSKMALNFTDQKPLLGSKFLGSKLLGSKLPSLEEFAVEFGLTMTHIRPLIAVWIWSYTGCKVGIHADMIMRPPSTVVQTTRVVLSSIHWSQY